MEPLHIDQQKMDRTNRIIMDTHEPSRFNSFCFGSEEEPIKKSRLSQDTINRLGFQEEIINTECHRFLAHLTPNMKETKARLKSILSRFQTDYKHGLGCIVAKFTEKQNLDLDRFVEKFSLAIFGFPIEKIRISRVARKQEFLGSKKQIALYLKVNVCHNLAEKYPELETDEEEYENKVDKFLQRYIDSLLFEFVPKEFVEILHNIYMDKEGTFMPEQSEKLASMKEKFQLLQPYHQLFLIVISLTSYLAYRCNPVNLDHFLNLCENPISSSVEWPIILSNRYEFQLLQPNNDNPLN